MVLTVLRLLTAGILLLICADAFAQRAADSTPDPFVMNETAVIWQSLPSRDVGAKTLSTQTINTGIQNCILFGAGQSNAPGANVAPSNFTPVNGSALDFLDPYDGAIYKATDPLVGGSYVNNPPPAGGAPMLRVADALVTAGKCARVIMVALAINASPVADWGTGLLSTRIPVAIKRLAVRGITPQTNVTFVVLWGQGEIDTANGTSQAAYQASFGAMVSLANAAGFSGRWLVARQSWSGSAFSAAVQAAQAALVNGSTIFAGANADAMTGNVCNGVSACRQGDALHWSDNGSLSYATDGTNGWVAALHASGLPF